jgi:hypothetical protein
MGVSTGNGGQVSTGNGGQVSTGNGGQSVKHHSFRGWLMIRSKLPDV